MIIDHEYRLVLTDMDAAALGYPNVASYRMAVAREVARAREKADAENGARLRAKLTKQQTVDAPTRFFTGARPKYSGE